MSKTTIKPFKSPIRWPGGKTKALKYLLPHIPEFKEYREPFVGGGSLYFYLKSTQPDKKYWINDLDVNLINFYQQTQTADFCTDILTALAKLEQRSVADKKELFERFKSKILKNDLVLPEHFFLVNRCSFSGSTTQGGFSPSAAEFRFNKSSIHRVSRMPEALKDTRITVGDYAAAIKEAGEDVFLFLDPPYFDITNLYQHGTFDHHRLMAWLFQTKHKFLLTYNDVPEIRNFYSWANVKEMQFSYGMTNCNREKTAKNGDELIITNF